MTDHSTIGLALVLIWISGLLGVMTVMAIRRIAGPPIEPAAPAVPPELDIATRVGKVLSDGMDRVDALHMMGADRFMTIMPMPDGVCWSVIAIRHPSEAAARRYHRPMGRVTH